MTGTLNLTATPANELDPVLARAQFFMELELLELTATIPQAAPRGVQKY